MNIRIRPAFVIRRLIKRAEANDTVTQQFELYSKVKGVYASRIFGLCIYRPSELK